ncbi:MAG: hypothetical protein R8G66_33930 [Cytophagales bacterium]|nr:hypothetical protein [Cytophagales bacterium]
MKKSFRYVLYILIGVLLYQLIESGNTSFTREELRDGLAIAIIGIFALLLVVRVMKNRTGKNDQ